MEPTQNTLQSLNQFVGGPEKKPKLKQSCPTIDSIRYPKLLGKYLIFLGDGFNITGVLLPPTLIRQ